MLMQNKIKAIFFDLDNVLVDMADCHWEALNMALKSMNYKPIDYDDHLTNYNGLPSKVKLKKLADINKINRSDRHAIWQKKQEFTLIAIDKMLKPIDSDTIDGFCALIAEGYELACVTNSIRKTAKAMLKKTDQYRFMSFLISNEDVNNPKPDSEPYVKAMKKMGVRPKESLIIEDSDVGIASAHASGGYVMPVKNYKYVTYDRIQKRLRKYKNVEHNHPYGW